MRTYINVCVHIYIYIYRQLLGPAPSADASKMAAAPPLPPRLQPSRCHRPGSAFSPRPASLGPVPPPAPGRLRPRRRPGPAAPPLTMRAAAEPLVLPPVAAAAQPEKEGRGAAASLPAVSFLALPPPRAAPPRPRLRPQPRSRLRSPPRTPPPASRSPPSPPGHLRRRPSPPKPRDSFVAEGFP